MNGARGIAVSPGTNTRDMVIVGVSLGGAPGSGVSIDGGTSKVGDAHVVERENARRAGGRPTISEAAGTGNIPSLFLESVCLRKDLNSILWTLNCR